METKIPKSMIVGVLSVMPAEETRPRKVRSISVVDPVGVGIFRRTLNIVTYYKEAGDNGERGWLVAGWIKESLGRALTEQPMLSGRLKRTKVENGLEVVANDSGVRLVEAKFPATLPEFLEMAKRDKTRAEAETVFWKDIDEDEPQFSPLFYVQVTNFERGGYSIGISCSFLIADLLLETDILNKWSKIQSSLAHSQTTMIKPIFYLPSRKRNPRNFFIELSRSDSVLDRNELVVFRAKTCPKMSPACMKQKTAVTSKKSSLDVFLFVKEKCCDEDIITGCDGRKVKIHSREEAVIEQCDCDCGDGDLEETDNGVLTKSLGFGERFEVPSCWVGYVSKGVVFVIPSSTYEDAKFIVALPKTLT